MYMRASWDEIVSFKRAWAEISSLTVTLSELFFPNNFLYNTKPRMGH